MQIPRRQGAQGLGMTKGVSFFMASLRRNQKCRFLAARARKGSE